ncbi:MAG: ABC transporter ATP-binding protein, partial [Clostridia bacterium]|nr:ABC transporter ATP-binding protein [Clostridia bacterium]
MKYILKYMKPFTRDCVMAPFMKALEVVFELCVPLIVADIIDVGVAGGDSGYIWGRTGVLLLLGVLGLITAVVAQYFSARAACGFARDVKSALFSHVGSLSYADLDRLGTSRMITSLTSDINQVQTGVNLTLRLFLRSPLVVFGAMVMALTIDVKAAVPFVIVIPVLSVVVFGIMLVSIPLYKKVQNALDRVLGRTRENLNGVRVIRAFCSEESEVAQFKADNAILTRAQKFVGRISALLNPVTYAIINLAIVLLVWKSAFRVDAGDLSQGQVVALWNYMSQILIELIKLANLIITIIKAVACGNRIGAVLQTESSQTYPAEAPTENEQAPAIEFKNVSLVYHENGENALDGISFSVKRGETVGIIGGTG